LRLAVQTQSRQDQIKFSLYAFNRVLCQGVPRSVIAGAGLGALFRLLVSTFDYSPSRFRAPRFVAVAWTCPSQYRGPVSRLAPLSQNRFPRRGTRTHL